MPKPKLTKLEMQVLEALWQKGACSVREIQETVSRARPAEMLQRLLETMVWDQTGMKGNYSFALRYEREDAPAVTDLPTLFEVVQRDLGLKLEKHKAPVEVLVVDSIEKTPTEN